VCPHAERADHESELRIVDGQRFLDIGLHDRDEAAIEAVMRPM